MAPKSGAEEQSKASKTNNSKETTAPEEQVTESESNGSVLVGGESQGPQQKNSQNESERELEKAATETNDSNKSHSDEPDTKQCSKRQTNNSKEIMALGDQMTGAVLTEQKHSQNESEITKTNSSKETTAPEEHITEAESNGSMLEHRESQGSDQNSATRSTTNLPHHGYIDPPITSFLNSHSSQPSEPPPLQSNDSTDLRGGSIVPPTYPNTETEDGDVVVESMWENINGKYKRLTITNHAEDDKSSPPTVLTPAVAEKPPVKSLKLKLREMITKDRTLPERKCREVVKYDVAQESVPLTQLEKNEEKAAKDRDTEDVASNGSQEDVEAVIDTFQDGNTLLGNVVWGDTYFSGDSLKAVITVEGSGFNNCAERVKELDIIRNNRVDYNYVRQLMYEVTEEDLLRKETESSSQIDIDVISPAQVARALSLNGFPHSRADLENIHSPKAWRTFALLFKEPDVEAINVSLNMNSCSCWHSDFYLAEL